MQKCNNFSTENWQHLTFFDVPGNNKNYLRHEFNSYPSNTSITWFGAVYTL